MNVQEEYNALRFHAHQLSGIITALNCCLGDPDRNDVCGEMLAEAEKLSGHILNEIDHVDPFNRKLGA